MTGNPPIVFDPADAVAITGMSMLTAFGNSVSGVADAIRTGQCAIRQRSCVDFGLPLRQDFTAGRVAGLTAGVRYVCKEAFAVQAALAALATARLDWSIDIRPDRAAVVVSAAGACSADLEGRVGQGHGMGYPNTADAVANACGFAGARVAMSNACAASSSAFAVGRALLRDDLADLVLVGGCELLDEMTVAGFAVLNSLASKPCSPYTRSDGLSLGEGGAMFAMERVADARDRAAPVFGYLIGCGGSGDGFHPTAPEPTGRYAALAMHRALGDGNLDAVQIDYVNGHGTGTAANDGMELRALARVFGEHRPVISSTKSQWGHPLLAAGALEAGVCMVGMQRGFVPPLLGNAAKNIASEPVAGLRLAKQTGAKKEFDVCMSNSFGFGGTNSSLLLGSTGMTVCERPPRTVKRAPARVYADLALAGDFGPLALVADTRGPIGPAVADFDGRPRGVNGAVWRRLETMGRCSVVAACEVVRRNTVRNADNCAVILATELGAIAAGEEFEASVMSGSPRPSLFPHCSHNTVAGHLAAAFGLHGPSLSFNGGPVAGLSAMYYGSHLVRSGTVDEALVVLAEDPAGKDSEHVKRGYASADTRLGGAIAVWLTRHTTSRQRISFEQASFGSCVEPRGRSNAWSRVLERCTAGLAGAAAYVPSSRETPEERAAAVSLGMAPASCDGTVLHRGVLSAVARFASANAHARLPHNQILGAANADGAIGAIRVRVRNSAV